MAKMDMHFQNGGGYDVELFVDAPDENLICPICQGVLHCPVRATCHHVFCKICIMKWLKRQETCPCCRKPISQSLIYVMVKLSKTIGRLKIKCRNKIQGCHATFPLSKQYRHGLACPFELVPCPYQGCRAQLQRCHLEAHTRHCERWSQRCPMGCGAVLTLRTRPHHNCYRTLQQRHHAQRQRQRAIAAALQRKMRKMQSAMERVRRQIGLICDSLEVTDDEEEKEEDVAAENETGAAAVDRSS